MDLPTRKPMRHKSIDYTENGYYFVTICAAEKKKIFGSVSVGQGLAPAETRLSLCGRIAEQQLLDLEKRYLQVRIDKYVVMPNHIHAILVLQNRVEDSFSVSDAICTFKSLTTRACHKEVNINHIFQSSFYDHVIRNQRDYEMIWNYIDTNPARWAEDRFFSNG